MAGSFDPTPFPRSSRGLGFGGGGCTKLPVPGKSDSFEVCCSMFKVSCPKLLAFTTASVCEGVPAGEGAACEAGGVGGRSVDPNS